MQRDSTTTQQNWDHQGTDALSELLELSAGIWGFLHQHKLFVMHHNKQLKI